MVIDHSLILRIPDCTAKFDWKCCSFRAGVRVLPAPSGAVSPNIVGIIPNFAYFFNENLTIILAYSVGWRRMTETLKKRVITSGRYA